MISIKRDFFAYLDELSLVTILLPFSYHKGRSNSFYLIDGNQQKPLFIKDMVELKDSIKYVCTLNESLVFGQTYWINDEHNGRTDLQIGAVIRTPQFDQIFYYEGHDLGVTYETNHTIFKIWAPTATDVRLKISSPDGTRDMIEMVRESNGVWAVTKEADLDGYHYTYLICVNLRWREAVDPYAKALTANGEKGVIINLEKTRTQKPPLPPFEHPVDAIIYETHIRDFTIHPESGTKQKGTYLGAAEINSSCLGATGLAYLKELGITHLELMPVNDFAGVNESKPNKDYNWGYNPLHFNAPDGSYSTDPSDPYKRIIELKQLIHTIQKQGIRVILDVVYNHVYDRETSSFEKIVPGYYFRHDEYGMASNGTGVGNDIASERKMVRKFIHDSVQFWLEEYDIDGLRFDLMGILDIHTMNAVRELADRLDPSLLIIGEGWDLNTPLPQNQKANLRNQAKLPRIAQFNDLFRDVIKGSTFNLYDKGYVLGNQGKLVQAKQVISGSVSDGLFLEPSQTVNYLESHDNHTMWDKFVKIFGTDQEELIRRYHRLATSILLLSQGIPFLHSGQEFFRTKQGNGNSYNAPDSINWLDWNRKQAYDTDVSYIKGIIELRKSHQAFRLRTNRQIQTHFEWLPIQEPLLGYRLKNVKGYGEWSELIVVFNPLEIRQTINLDIKGDWFVLANHQQAGSRPISRLQLNEIHVEPVSILVFGK
ncbi:type I pullulanase [Pseudoneobacillus sp. C159]